MDVVKYITSGILELYVAGALSEKENLEIDTYAKQYPEVKEEILSIEAAILELTASSSNIQPYPFTALKQTVAGSEETRTLPLRKAKSPLIAYMGWAASVLLAIGFFWSYTQNQKLKSELEVVSDENLRLENAIATSDASLEKSQALLNTLRDKEIDVITLDGQTIAPEAYAKVYWNKTVEKVYIDAKGLPEPPDGFVYQVWSLKLSPTLSPTSIGILDTFYEDENKVFQLPNPNNSEAFGITLEPAGGSATPNLEQLYALGALSAS